MEINDLKGNIPACVKYVSDRFEYKSDARILDWWSVLKLKDGKFVGDCEDFSLTVFWYYYGCSLPKFLYNFLIRRKSKILFVKARTGEGHAVGETDGYLFDNWTREAIPSEEEFYKMTGHQYKREFYLPLTQLILGYIKRVTS